MLKNRMDYSETFLPHHLISPSALSSSLLCEAGSPSQQGTFCGYPLGARERSRGRIQKEACSVPYILTVAKNKIFLPSLSELCYKPSWKGQGPKVSYVTCESRPNSPTESSFSGFLISIRY